MAEPYMWPARLPQSPRRSSYSRGLANNATRMAMEFGPAKVRRRSSSNSRLLTVTYMLNEQSMWDQGDGVNQKTLFDDFYGIVDCVMSFWLPDPEDATRCLLARIMADSEEQGVSMTLLAPHLWSVTLKLEVFPNVPTRPRV